MQQLFGFGRFRSREQALATQAVWRRDNHVLGVLSTGGGKTLIAQVAAHLDRQAGKVNVILVPLKALADDLTTRIQKSGMIVERWQGTKTAWTQVVIAIFEDAAKPEFIAQIKARLNAKTMGRIVIDECHYPVNNGNLEFRPHMNSLASLVLLGIQLVLLTATAPHAETDTLLNYYGVPQATVIRAPTNRANIKYTAHKVARPTQTSPEKFAYSTLKSQSRAGKTIVFMQSKKLIEGVMKERANDQGAGKERAWVRYHADMRDDDKKAALRDWATIMLATNAFGLGVSREDCDKVIHWEAPYTLLDYVQESGRAGRSGQDSVAILYYTHMPSGAPAGENPGRKAMVTYAETGLCRRWILSGYMDGPASTCFGLPEAYQLCDNCSKAQETHQAPDALPPPPNEPGPKIAAAAASASALAGTEDFETLMSAIEPLQDGCMRCYVNLDTLGRHIRSSWNCPSGKFNKNTFDPYATWRKGWAPPCGYKEKLCQFCWLPNGCSERYHKPDDTGLGACIYADVLRPMAWFAFLDDLTMEAFGRAFPDANVETTDGWTQWLRAKTPRLGWPRLFQFAVWYAQYRKDNIGLNRLG